VLATAVWTGSVVVVWGGGSGATDYATGARYEPVTDSWQPISAIGAPSARRAAYGFWTGSRVLFHGGATGSNAPVDGTYLYDPENDTWTQGDTASQPEAMLHVTLGLSSSQLFVNGGLKADGGVSQMFSGYTLSADRWKDLKKGPSPRYGALGGWDGGLMVVWGGTMANALRPDGRKYDPGTDSWITMQTLAQPSPRWAPHRATGWSARIRPGVTLVMGGAGASSTPFFTDGGIYNSTPNTWTSVTGWPSGLSHLWGVGVWTGSEFFVWGGRTATGATLTSGGERYLP
jgi:hypothetical protein